MLNAVRPYASQREALELEQARAQIAQIRASTAASYRSGSGSETSYSFSSPETKVDSKGNVWRIVYRRNPKTGKEEVASRTLVQKGAPSGGSNKGTSWFGKASNYLTTTVKNSPGYKFVSGLFK
jgi:hypothetical protein